MLVDITVDGRAIKAVAMPSKQSFLYMFDRITGQPIWPMPETPVPGSNVPGEKVSPTQPIPSKPPAFARAFLAESDLIDFTPALRAQALENLKNYRWEQTPFVPAVIPVPGGPQGSINVGNTAGGVNWAGSSLDPDTQVAFIQAGNSSVTTTAVTPVPPERGDATYTQGGGLSGGPETGRFSMEAIREREQASGGIGAGRGRGAAPAGGAEPAGRGAAPAAGRGGGGLGEGLGGLPIVKPPYGVLTAVDLNKGEIKWQVPHGETPDNVRNNPLLRGMDIPRTGQGGSLGLLVTKTLVVLGDGQVTSPPGRERGAMLRAYDKNTGANVGEVWMPAGQGGGPMTYVVDGKQYIVLSIGGGNYPGEYMAFSLPDSEIRSTGGQ
jgi:quinoprotein glucose dehydrogenase